MSETKRRLHPARILTLSAYMSLSLLACEHSRSERALDKGASPTTNEGPHNEDGKAAKPDMATSSAGGSAGPGGSINPEQPGIGTGGAGGADATGMPNGTESNAPDSTAPDTTSEAESGTDSAPECNELDPVRLFLSPDDSNSLSSPAQIKQRLLVDKMGIVSGVPIRGWEFFNYYNFPYPEPQELLGVHLELREVEGSPGQHALQIGVRSKNWNYESRPKMNLTLVLDTSGSMAGPSINLLKASARSILSQLRAGDLLSMVTWSSTQKVLLDSHAVSAGGDARVNAILDTLQANGGTDLHGGLSRGYALAQKNFLPGAINRVILVSDGGANLGVTSKDLIAEHAKDSGKDGIYLAGVGVGHEGSYNDALMDAVTDAGKGASVFVFNNQEAQRIFADHFFSTMGVAAKNVRVQLDLPPGYELVTFSGEEASENPAEVEPQHLAPNDSMVFHQVIQNCAPEKVDQNAPIKVTVRYQDATTHQPGVVQVESTMAKLLAAPAPALGKGIALTAFVDALKAQQKRETDARVLVDKAKSLLEAEIAKAPHDAELKELLEMLSQLRQ